MPITIAKLRQQLPEILEDAENNLTMAARVIFSDLQRQLIDRDTYGNKVQAVHRASEVSQRLAEVPGIGLFIATALLAWQGLCLRTASCRLVWPDAKARLQWRQTKTTRYF